MPCIDPNAEGEYVVDPFFWVVIVFVFAQDKLASREAIGAKVSVSLPLHLD